MQHRCRRYRADGSPCTHLTEYADGWCREPGCPGFQRASAASAPETFGHPQGTPRHLRESGDVVIKGVSIEDVHDVRVTQRALDSFRFHHGGGEAEAEAQLRTMLEDFLVSSARRTKPSGFTTLAREGFVLVLSPDRWSITGYSTVHRERTWAQVKGGVPSRISRRYGAPSPWRDTFAPVPEQGPPVQLERFADVVDPATIRLTARVLRSYARVSGLGPEWDEEFEGRLRSDFARFADGGAVEQREDGIFVVGVDGRVWLVAPDARTLIGVR